VEGLGVTDSRSGDRDLRVIDAGEVAGTGRLVFLGLERERVRVDTGVGGAGVVVVGLHLVEVLTFLFLEAILAVEDELELGEGTNSVFREGDGGTSGADRKEGRTRQRGGHEAVGRGDLMHVGINDDVVGILGEVPQGRGRGSVGEAPHELLNGVVVGEADLLNTGRIDGIDAGVLHLLDQVFMTLLREAATLLGVEVDVVGPHLEGGGQVSAHVGGEVDVDTHLVVLEGDEGEVQPGVAVEEEDEGKVDSLAGVGSGHLTVRGLLGFIEVKLRVQTPPFLVVLVDALTTDGKFNVVDRTLSDPAGSLGVSGGGDEFEVHVTDKVTVTGDSHGDATTGGGGTVDGLLDVLHREVSVALVFRLEEGHLRVTGKVNILGTVSYELHETTGHFESCCTLYGENNSGGMRIYRFQKFSVYTKCRNSLMKLKKEKLNIRKRRKEVFSRWMRRWTFPIFSDLCSRRKMVIRSVVRS